MSLYIDMYPLMPFDNFQEVRGRAWMRSHPPERREAARRQAM